MFYLPQFSKTAKEELKEFNIQKEYKAIHKLYIARDNKFKNKYEEARYKILKYMITCTINDPQNGDYYDEKNNNLIKEAGNLLYEFEGMDGLHDGLVWSFIPRRYVRDIEILWNGIGNWRS